MRDPTARQLARAALQAQRRAAILALERERVLRQVLDALDPQPGDIHLDYPLLLARVLAVLRGEQERTAMK